MINTPKKGIHRFAKSNSFDETKVSDEVARVLFINEDYAIKRMKFFSLEEICFHNLWLAQGSKQIKVMRHYFNNGANYIMSANNFADASQEKIEQYRQYNKTFLSIVERINKLTSQQKKSFLDQMEHHHDTDQTIPTPNPITVMDTILSLILK